MSSEMAAGQCLRDLREAAQITQAELAEMLMIGAHTIAEIEKGAKAVPSFAMAHLARVFDMPAHKLASRFENDEPARAAA